MCILQTLTLIHTWSLLGGWEPVIHESVKTQYDQVCMYVPTYIGLLHSRGMTGKEGGEKRPGMFHWPTGRFPLGVIVILKIVCARAPEGKWKPNILRRTGCWHQDSRLARSDSTPLHATDDAASRFQMPEAYM